MFYLPSSLMHVVLTYMSWQTVAMAVHFKLAVYHVIPMDNYETSSLVTFRKLYIGLVPRIALLAIFLPASIFHAGS